MTEYRNKYWTLDDIPWDSFDPTKVDRNMMRIVKAAAMVEYNGGIYAEYLCSIFAGDPHFQDAAITVEFLALTHSRKYQAAVFRSRQARNYANGNPLKCCKRFRTKLFCIKYLCLA